MKYLFILFCLLYSCGLAYANTCGYNQFKAQCVGDINCDCHVTINEIQTCIAAANYSGDSCTNNNPSCANAQNISHCDTNCNWSIEINELILAVNNANLAQCGAPGQGCWSGTNYPVFGSSTVCSLDIWRQINSCQPFGFCTRQQCASC